MYLHEKRAPQEFSRSTCRKIIWDTYRLAPSIAWFSLQVLSRFTKDVLEVLEFSKLNEEERQRGEQSLYRLIGQIYKKYRLDQYASYPRITCDFRNGFGCDCIIRIYVND